MTAGILSHLDFFMLKNVGTNIKGVDWVHMDAEAMNQKDNAQWRGNAVPMALSYTKYEIGGYFGWTLSRYWGVANWSSTLNHRLVEDPEDAREQEVVIAPTNNWELNHSNLDIRECKDKAELRLVNNKLCKDNGYKDENGLSPEIGDDKRDIRVECGCSGIVPYNQKSITRTIKSAEIMNFIASEK